MVEHRIKYAFFIGFIFLIALMLLIVPLPRWILWYRPAWVWMVLFFWMINAPRRVNVGIACGIGLLMDLLMGTLLGQHALVLTIMAYFVAKFQVPIRSFPVWQKTLLLFMLMLVYLALQYWLMALAGLSPPDTWKYWLPLFTTPLLWPWVNAFLQNLRYRFEKRLGSATILREFRS